MLQRLSLRARLLLAVLVVAAVGLVAADVATYRALSSFLVDRTDSSLEDSAHSIRRPGGERAGPPGVAVQVRSADGTTVLVTLPTIVIPGEGEPAPKLPGTILPPTGGDGREAVRYFTVPGQDRGSYRVRASVEEGARAMLVVSTSLADVSSTLDRLLLIELVVTAFVLAGIAALGLWLVRVGLRPLDAIEGTAAAIAAGDLSRRVERAEDRTEVGRLGLSLNAMLAQIESAFRAREASERKLRRFVADASHELRTPLAAVRAYAELFERGAATRPDDLERSMTGISRESERMSLLVDDLLLLARLDDGRPLARDRVQLDEVVGEAVETAQAVDAERPIELDADPRPLAPDLGQPPRERARSHSAGHARGDLGAPAERGGGDRGARQRPRARRGAPRARLRALLPRRLVARPGERGRRPRPLDRRRGRRGARRARLGALAAGRRRDVRDLAAARRRRLIGAATSTAGSHPVHRAAPARLGFMAVMRGTGTMKRTITEPDREERP
jgi:two-component system, OmpR family, sensor kinase